jgi:nucleotide-binding universal stress UspA family protein
VSARRQTVVVGYDGSDSSRRALARATEVAPGASIVVVHATPSVYGTDAYRVPDTGEERRGEALLEEATTLLRERGVTPETRSPVGDAADELVALARDVHADLLVVGRRRSAVAHLLGSVSSSVVRNAPCDVLVVR